MTALITGGSGLIGSHLARLLRERGERVVVASASERAVWPASDVERARLDVTDRGAVFELIARLRPTEVYHLAARSMPAPSWEDGGATMTVNALGTIHLLDALRAASLAPRTFIACSSAQYGMVPLDEAPVAEDRPCEPLHPYGVSKLAQEHLGRVYHQAHAIPTVLGRIFNTTGPGESHDAALRWARRIAELERAGGGALATGELSMLRDLSDPRDMARAVLAATRRGEPGAVYNLCSGQARTMRSVAEALVAQARAPIRIERDASIARPLDERVIWGDPAKLREHTGHAPRVPFERTMRDVMAYARGDAIDFDA